MIQSLKLENGKYELRFDDASGALCAYRHGEPWQDFSGNKLVYLLMQAALAAKPQPLTDEQKRDALGTAGPDLLELAKRWADNSIHVYQFVAEAERIVVGAVERAHGIGGTP